MTIKYAILLLKILNQIILFFFRFKHKGCDEEPATLRDADNILERFDKTKDLSILEPILEDELIKIAEKKIARSKAQRDEVFKSISCLKNWVGEEIKKGLNENEVITDQQYDDATSLCFSNEFFTGNGKD